MRILLSNSKAKIGGDELGQLITPKTGNRVCHDYWAADNNAFSGFDAADYYRLLHRCNREQIPPRWVAVPDVVGDWRATRAKYSQWFQELYLRRLPIAYVAQDDVPLVWIPWRDMACLFLGGTTAYKLSDAALKLCWEARDLGKIVHVGRVNSFVRIRRFLDVADSIDGHQWHTYSQRYLARGLQWIRQEKSQMRLFPTE